MKLLELHILQSFPVSCLNRDDVGAPKSALFGGAPRARISSQSLKRAIRMAAKDIAPDGTFEGIRTRQLHQLFLSALEEKGAPEPEKSAQQICETLSKIDKKNEDQVTTAVFLSPGEIDQIATAVAAGETAKKATKAANRNDAADIALFGRMIANDATLNVEGAAMFSHALSTHEVSNENDFFSAVDDQKKDAEDAGAGMIGTLEFNSALYYRYAAVNLDLLTDNLGNPSSEELENVLRIFIKSTLEAVPGARQNSMNAHVRPSYVLGTLKEQGQPVQLINAFEKPVWNPGQGFLADSIKSLQQEKENLTQTWGLKTDAEAIIPEVGLDDFLSTLLSQVHA